MKEPRAHFGVYKVNRVALLVLGLALVALVTYRYNPIQKVSSMVDRMQYSRVAGGVTLDGRHIGGKTAEELTLLIQSMAKDRAMLPQNAMIDPKSKGVVPDVSGIEVDVASTVKEILSLPSGSKARLVMKEVAAQKTLRDFPDVPVFNGNPAKKAVSLVINVAWGTEFVQPMLEKLEKENVKATFFIMGNWAGKNPDVLKKIVAAGHEIAVHGHDDSMHPGRVSKEALKSDITKALQAIDQAAGVRPQFYSPHMSELGTNFSVSKTAAELGLRTVMYSVDTIDWQNPPPSTIVQRVLSNAGNGDIVLMHPKANTLQALDPMIKGLKDRGFQLVPVGNLISPLPLADAKAISTVPKATPTTGTPAPTTAPAIPAPSNRPLPALPY